MHTARPARAATFATLVLIVVSVTALLAGDLTGYLTGGTATSQDAVVPGGRWSEEHDSGTGGASAPEDVTTDPSPDLLAAGQAVDAGGTDPGLEAALAEARRLAAAAGFELPVSSAHRSAEEQLATLEAEIERRGSVEEALRWVFAPDRSMHVRGLAIDVNGGPAADWLDAHGARFGLCRTLEWEWWHFEWRQRWQDEARCPRPVTDPAEAPGP